MGRLGTHYVGQVLLLDAAGTLLGVLAAIEKMTVLLTPSLWEWVGRPSPWGSTSGALPRVVLSITLHSHTPCGS
jgi:hypothetical protein